MREISGFPSRTPLRRGDKGGLFSSLFLLALLTACSTNHFTPRAHETYITGIPIYEQSGADCGPATLASAMSHYGVSVTPDSIAAATHRESIEGTLTLDMVVFAKSHGLDARLYRSSRDDLMQHIENGDPIIAMIETVDPNPLGGISRAITNTKSPRHYILVIGYSTKYDYFIAHTGDKAPERIGMDEFMEAWRKTGYVAITFKRG